MRGLVYEFPQSTPSASKKEKGKKTASRGWSRTWVPRAMKPTSTGLRLSDTAEAVGISDFDSGGLGESVAF